MGKRCEICAKRSPKYPVNVQISSKKEQIIEMCWACNKQYMKLRAKY